MEKLIEKAKDYLKYGLSEAYIESKLWASRNPEIGMRHITEAIREAKK